MRRRDFLWALGGLPVSGGAEAAGSASGRRPQRLLILGGTGFLGPHVVEAARRRGLSVTLFNRGVTNPTRFAGAQGVEQVLGDRQAGLTALRGRSWDVVLDTSAHVPRLVRESALFLRGAVGRYIYVSSTAVYRDRAQALDETSKVATLPSGLDPAAERVTDVSFGPLKALCEDEVRRAFAERALIFRPGHLVGPGDPTERLTYWLARTARGGEVVAPGQPGDPVQILDVRDLAAWIVAGTERGLAGTLNAVGPSHPLAMEPLLQACRKVVGSRLRLVFAGVEVLRQLGLLGKLPLWLPTSESGLARVSGQRALGEGLRHRPLSTTLRDTWQWLRSQPKERREAAQAGLSSDEEAQVLTALRSRQALR
jgi:2'-hydroxyisoflavone reductase